MNSAQTTTAMFLPGGVLPAAPSYAPLLGALGGEVQPILKDLELYAADRPPSDYSLQLEVDGIGRAADAAGAQRFHLVGYSGGGACCLAFVAQHPERVASLALDEPAWVGSVPPGDEATWRELQRIVTLPPAEQMPAFIRWHFRPGIDPPKPAVSAEPPPPWMASRPAGLRAMAGVFNTEKIDQNRFRLFKGPVYYSLGSLTARYFEHEAQILSGLFPDFQLEEYVGRSHLDAPHHAEPERFANALKALWKKPQAA